MTLSRDDEVTAMRREVSSTTAWGLVLVAVSGLMLLARLGRFPTAALFWTLAFTAVGSGFGAAYLTSARRWWAAIPAGAALGLGAVLAWTELAGRDADVGGALFLALVGLGFWAVYARDRRHWWAIIPAGVSTTSAVVAGLSSSGLAIAGAAIGATFLLGLAATFALVAVLPTGGPRRWAYVPAAVLAVLAVLPVVDAVAALPGTDDMAPAVVAAIGLVLLWRSLAHGRGHG